jgi:hypothetical protein
MTMKKARVIAYYLPQYHPIPENDAWWGKGFTEWRNVALAKPLFRNHYQPKVPADLGFYDLRMPEIREQQATLAKEAGIEGFCYWHYWFGNGKMLLERPFNEVLASGKPDFPFCLGWANHSWTNKTWNKGKTLSSTSILMEQTYPNMQDINDHFNYCLRAFKDDRYIKIDDKPIFVVFSPLDIPNADVFIEKWQCLAKESGLSGIYFIGIASNFNVKNDVDNSINLSLKSQSSKAINFYNRIFDVGFDGVNSRGNTRAEIMSKGFVKYYFEKFLKYKLKLEIISKFNFDRIYENLYVEEDELENVFPTLIPNWDRSPRSGKDALIWYNTTPELFYDEIQLALKVIAKKDYEHKILFLQSWNEWGEGNYVEPDCKYGKSYIYSLKKSILDI